VLRYRASSCTAVLPGQVAGERAPHADGDRDGSGHATRGGQRRAGNVEGIGGAVPTAAAVFRAIRAMVQERVIWPRVTPVQGECPGMAYRACKPWSSTIAWTSPPRERSNFVAQKVQTLYIDDIDGSEAAGTVRFGLVRQPPIRV